ncbi:DEAD/DEAH box helicase [Peribacillus frigoritolerans]|uniref:DEAD/DEAH box helicase n=1 Tax=Peribacillus frigoritolerans TaxID=450367 RepID=UPI0032E3E2EF
MSSVLVDWIQESNSWRNAKELDVLDRQEKEYTFLKRSDDYYISLFNKIFKSLTSGTFSSKENQQELLLIAKGLELYSVQSTRGNFFGVNYAENILYASSIYYLTDYYTTSVILARMFETEDYESEIDQFIHAFLIVNRNVRNSYMDIFNSFLETGNQQLLNNVIKLIDNKLKTSDPYKFAPLLLAKKLLEKFSENNIWHSLTRANPDIKWNDFILNKIDNNWVLFPSQESALKKGILIKDNSFSLQMPTSSGKTSLCEIIIYNEIVYNNRKVLLLAPYRALASELKYTFSSRFKNLGLTVKTLYGGHIPTREEKEEIDSVDLLICTPEKFMAIENHIPNLHNSFSTVICDEGHLLDDAHRGLNYELLLAKFKNSNNSQDKKFIYLSAIIPNIETINSWLGGDKDSLIKSHYRPTDLSYGFLIEQGVNVNKIFNLKMYSKKNELIDFSINNLLTVKEDYKYKNPLTNRINIYKYNTFKAKAISVAMRSLNNGSVALFTPQKGNTGVKGLAEELIKQINLLNFPKPVDFSRMEELLDLITYFRQVFGEDYILTKSVMDGFVFHHGDLPQFVREIIENCIRQKIVSLIICTNTLAEGVNLPIKTLVLHSIKRFDYSLERMVKIRKRDIKNIIGRAGRAGQETEGIVISVNPNEYNYIEEVISEDQIEPVKGYLFHIINDITNELKDDRFLITNELIDQKDEEFKRLIDSIDKSIIDSLYEETIPDNINIILESLISKTYSYFQSDNDNKLTLEHIFKLRGSVLSPYLKKNEISILKESDTTVRIYEDIRSVINLQDDIWQSFSLPIGEDSLGYMIDIILSVKHLQFDFEQFDEINDIKLTKELITKIIQNWVDGKWYQTISIQTKIEVDDILKIILFINSNIYPVISKIITIVKGELQKHEISISKDLEDLGLFLQYGINSRVHLNLIELGFTERMSTLSIGDWIYNNFKNLDLNDKYIVEMIIKENKAEMKEFLIHSVPNISLNVFNSNLRNF